MFKNQGHKHGSVAVERADWPGEFLSVGSFTVALPGLAETSRDFTRAFSACKDGAGDMFVLGAAQLKNRAAGPAPIEAELSTGGDVNAEIVAKAVAEFKEQTVLPALAATGAVGLAGEELEALMGCVIGNLTVTPSMEGLMSNGASPAMFQNKYVLATGGLSGVRVVTYGFICSAMAQPLGDRPDRKYTPFVLRLVTEDLLAVEPGAAVEVSYSVRPSCQELCSDAMAQDTHRLKYATATGDWLHFFDSPVGPVRSPPPPGLCVARLTCGAAAHVCDSDNAGSAHRTRWTRLQQRSTRSPPRCTTQTPSAPLPSPGVSPPAPPPAPPPPRLPLWSLPAGC